MRICVCVPARNEADRLPVLLAALRQQTVSDFSVVVSLNNTTDKSYAVLKGARSFFGERLVIDQVSFSSMEANAGMARKRAMDLGASGMASDGVLISTDADTRPPLEWIDANRAALSGEADIVGGRIKLDDDEPAASSLRTIADLSNRYWASVRAIEDAIDPVPHDPPPRHGDHTGASLALRVGLYRRAGGVPSIPTGEDRALVRAAVAAGGRLAHPPSVWTRVSGRSDGRAIAGMAQEMARWSAAVPLVPSFEQWTERAKWRRGVRDARGAAAVVLEEENLPPMICNVAIDRVELNVADPVP